MQLRGRDAGGQLHPSFMGEGEPVSDEHQTIRFRLSVDITRPSEETAKDISDSLQEYIEEIEGVESVRELGWRRMDTPRRHQS